MKIRPLRSLILARPIPQADTTASGIYLGAASDQTNQSEFEVLAVGRGTYNDKGETIVPEVCKGWRVLANSWAGTEVMQDGEKLRLIESTSVIAILSQPSGYDFKAKISVPVKDHSLAA